MYGVFTCIYPKNYTKHRSIDHTPRVSGVSGVRFYSTCPPHLVIAEAQQIHSFSPASCCPPRLENPQHTSKLDALDLDTVDTSMNPQVKRFNDCCSICQLHFLVVVQLLGVSAVFFSAYHGTAWRSLNHMSSNLNTRNRNFVRKFRERHCWKPTKNNLRIKELVREFFCHTMLLKNAPDVHDPSKNSNRNSIK